MARATSRIWVRMVQAGGRCGARGAVGPPSNPVGTVLELEVVLANVTQSAPLQKTWCLRIARSNAERPCFAVECRGLPIAGVAADSEILACAKRGPVAPLATLVGREACSPHVTLCAAVAIAIKEPRYVVLPP